MVKAIVINQSEFVLRALFLGFTLGKRQSMFKEKQEKMCHLRMLEII